MTYKILPDYSECMSASSLQILWNAVNLFRNGKNCNTKYNFFKLPAGNAEFTVYNFTYLLKSSTSQQMI